VIHSAIHRARHEVDCIIHTHTIAGMAVSAMKAGLMPFAQTAMRFIDIGYTSTRASRSTWTSSRAWCATWVVAKR